MRCQRKKRHGMTTEVTTPSNGLRVASNPTGDEGLALGRLADILLNSAYSEEELDKEREVILQEIAAAQDSPDDIVFDLMHATAFPGQAVGRPILGTPKSVGGLQAAGLRAFLAQPAHPARR